MTLILFFTTAGFIAGLIFVMVQRRIRPGTLLTATFAGLVASAFYKLMQDYYRKQRR